MVCWSLNENKETKKCGTSGTVYNNNAGFIPVKSINAYP